MDRNRVRPLYESIGMMVNYDAKLKNWFGFVKNVELFSEAILNQVCRQVLFIVTKVTFSYLE